MIVNHYSVLAGSIVNKYDEDAIILKNRKEVQVWDYHLRDQAYTRF